MLVESTVLQLNGTDSLIAYDHGLDSFERLLRFLYWGISITFSYIKGDLV